MAKVLNISHCPGRRTPDDAINIMRPSEWGNPFIIGVDGDRDDVVEKFRSYALARLKKEPDWLEPLRGYNLVCCCKPKACHGDVILELLSK